MPETALRHSFHAAIGEIPKADWDGLAGPWLDAYPFLAHDFLALLERTGCVGAGTGWQPAHLRLRQGEDTVAAMPLYVKTHSWGEYVFDWSWANAWVRATGTSYYPKLVSAIPMTPCAGPRLLVAPRLAPARAAAAAFAAVQELAEQVQASGWHLLFSLPSQLCWWDGLPLTHRLGQQFQWFRRDASAFDDYLEAFKARQRKTIRRERRLVREQGFDWRFLSGDEMGAAEREALWHFYQLTYLRRGSTGYLSREFFERAPATLGPMFRGLLCYRGEKPVAGAVLYAGREGIQRDATAVSASGRGKASGAAKGGRGRADAAPPGCPSLYGRHWGCYEEYDQLHFEACYYRGIEACLEHGWDRFDSGVQGEHKIRRGFIPVPTVSAHWIRDQRLRDAVAGFCRAEAGGQLSYRRACLGHLPFNDRHVKFADWQNLAPEARAWFAGGPQWQ